MIILDYIIKGCVALLLVVCAIFAFILAVISIEGLIDWIKKERLNKKIWGK